MKVPRQVSVSLELGELIGIDNIIEIAGNHCILPKFWQADDPTRQRSPE
jgi:hypothetical protein